MIFIILTFSTLIHCIFSQTILQTPLFISKFPGDTVKMDCSVKGTSSLDMYWYRQDSSGGIEMLFLSRAAGMVDESPIKDFTAQRTDSESFSLQTERLSLNHTAVYYCAWSTGGNNPAYFGNGTKLTVLEHNISEPILHILEPSKEEIVQKKRVTLVCLATNFYPDHINITWKINGKNRTGEDGVKTDDYAIKDNKTNNYSISSRLRLTPREWFNPENTFTCAVKFYKGNGSEIVTPEKHISGKDGCGMTKALNRSESVAARISYMLLVGKSLMYGLFVTFLVWKLRPNSSSKRLN